MNSPAVDIATILETYSIGTIGDDIHISALPDKPDACISVYDTGGFAPQSSYKYDYPTVQVRIRGTIGGYVTGYSKAESIKNLLHDLHGQSWGVSWYIGVWAMSDILFLGHDDKNRPEFSVNFRIHRTE